MQPEETPCWKAEPGTLWGEGPGSLRVILAGLRLQEVPPVPQLRSCIYFPSSFSIHVLSPSCVQGGTVSA